MNFMNWLNNLLPASFRGVPFQVSGTSSEFGRRNQTHEYPFRDVPYTEDLGRSARKNKIDAFVVGDDHKEQAEKLVEAIEEEGAGTLIHPILGELNVNIVGTATVSNSVENGRMSVISFSFVEAGELIFPDSSVATDDVVDENADNVDQALLDAFEDFDLIDAPDFVQHSILDDTMSILNDIADAYNAITPYVNDAVKILNGDLSPILGAGGSAIINSIKNVWKSATKFSNSINGLIARVKVFNGISFIKSILPSAIWSTDSKSTKKKKKNQNLINTAIRVTALTEASRIIASLPKQVEDKRKQAFAPVALESTKGKKEHSFGHSTANITSTSVSTSSTVEKSNTISFDELLDIKESINESFDKELSRTEHDGLYIALVKLKAAVNQDINARLIKIEKTIVYIPNEVLPDLVLAHYLYNNAMRCEDISIRNNILHPGFITVKELRVPKP
ncbi:MULTISPECIES: DNA circularization protein [unclassified Gilliamella]|uniref:DNA circularization protein n=1 Tax=unclassified Gilliamella TaxID=2685620 RepID=UPI002269AE14|nr:MULTISPECIES: DNA circularization N-terminal domain-containing protein [unclassified Gilliamella]MCX8574516.1 DNA circularization N-terminal domain-containing protein [Gilliamella sp. B3831]MCX8576747.1 DNA circularization N-terminal domain-containing protein [Gilliamella sp. B3815]MCX8589271.1 DNA circularization N-terminal domain-containing protein [Gilliamella sp. B3812]MCX8603845.1 DNA circularization N-terminal domain-containing protein [Gilliamella sp. B3823]MCX8606725.1 DNA circulari